MEIKLRELRKNAGFISARQFAAHVGIHEKTYANYEQGRRNIDNETLCVIADALGCSVDEILGHEILGRNKDETSCYESNNIAFSQNKRGEVENSPRREKS